MESRKKFGEFIRDHKKKAVKVIAVIGGVIVVGGIIYVLAGASGYTKAVQDMIADGLSEGAEDVLSEIAETVVDAVA